VGAQLCQLDGRGFTDTGISAGDNDRFAGQVVIHQESSLEKII
jgi:hypothetical protein